MSDVWILKARRIERRRLIAARLFALTVYGILAASLVWAIWVTFAAVRARGDAESGAALAHYERVYLAGGAR